MPAAAILTAAPLESGGALSFARLPVPALAIDRPEGRHLLVRQQGADRQLWIVGDPPPTAPVATVIPLDAYVPQRIAATLRLWHQLMGPAPQPVAPLTGQQRRRLILMLRALDGWHERASYRDLAVALLDAQVRSQPRREWLTSPRRAQIIRVVKDAIRRMRGGYRDLLRGR